MREHGESIALLYHATGTGKTVTAVSDAKRLGKRTLFLAHTKELITQAKGTFEELWDEAEIGLYVAEEKAENAYIVCSSIQSVARNLEGFKPDDFGYIIVDECHHVDTGGRFSCVILECMVETEKRGVKKCLGSIERRIKQESCVYCV